MPRLSSRPGIPSSTIQPGLHSLDLHWNRRALLYVPTGYDPDVASAFVLMFHGAGGGAPGPINLFRPNADDAGLILLAVDSYDYTWDAARRGEFGEDVDFVDYALEVAFDQCAVDASRVFVEGFSDGATYAIAMGRANGDLISRVAAFSPGYIIPVPTVGSPAFYISHGTQDTVLPIEAGRRVAAELREDYEVVTREFDGGHFVPPDVLVEAKEWLVSSS